MSINQSPRLLVVDDDLGVIASYRMVMEGAGPSRQMPAHAMQRTLEDELFGPDEEHIEEQLLDVSYFDSGAEAVDAVRHAAESGKPYALAFIDMRMPPGLDGLETAARIRAIDSRMYIAIVSGFSDYTEDEINEAAGPADRIVHLSKPVSPSRLREHAAELIGLWNSEGQAAG